MSKKLLTILLAMILLIAFAIVPNISFAAETEDSSNSEIELEAMSLLMELGIFIEDDGITADSNITRGFAAVVSTRLHGLFDLAPCDTSFSDVNSTNINSGAIEAAKNLGIINGFGDGMFHPEDTLTYNQWLKVLVTSLGYGVKADVLGGYHGGYLIAAQDLGLLKGVSKTDENIHVGTMALTIKNALDVQVLKGEYENWATGRPLCEEYLGLKKIEAQVTGTYFKNFSGKTLLNGQAALDGTVVNVGTSKIESYLGMRVAAYVKENKNTTDLTVIAITPYDSTVYEIQSSSVVLSQTSGTLLKYTDDENRTRSVAISTDAVFIKNGEYNPLHTIVRNDFNISEGIIKLISSTGGGVDVVIVDSYENGIVESIDLMTNTVYFKNTVYGVKSFEVDPNSISVKTSVLYKDGSPSAIDEFSTGNIVSVIKSSNTLQMILCDTQIKGELTALNDEYAVINDQKYTIAQLSKNAVANGVKPLQIGEGIYALDYTGKLAMLVREATGDNSPKYGYVVAGAIKRGMIEGAQLKLFSQDGEWKTLDLASKVKFNGLSVNAKDVLAHTSPMVTGGINSEAENGINYDQEYIDYRNANHLNNKVYEQLVMYRVNENGLITELDTAVRGSDLSDAAAREQYFSRDNGMDINKYQPDSSGKWAARFYGSPSSEVDGGFFLRSTTKIFKVPDKYTGSNERMYQIKPYTSIEHSSNDPSTYHFDVRLYDVDDKTRIAGAMVTRMLPSASAGSAAEFISNWSGTGLVQSVYEGLTESGEVRTIVAVFRSGKITNYFVDSDRDFIFNKAPRYGVLTKIVNESADVKNSDGTLKECIKANQLNPGDVIQFATAETDGGYEITDAMVLFRAKSPIVGERAYEESHNLSGSGKGTVYIVSHYLYGKVKSVCPETIIMEDIVTPCSAAEYPSSDNGNSLDPTKKYERVFPFGGRVVIFNTRDNSIETVTASSIHPGDYAFILKNKLEMRWIIVYR